MDQPTQERLFQAFRQGDSSMSRRFGGTGLGLAISQRLVERMGGRIQVRSTPGQGSVFNFSLAFPRAEDRPDLPVPAPQPLSGRVLVVEDDRVNQGIVLLMLERLGMTAELAESGGAALDAVQRAHWNAVLMDCKLPGMDGCETTRRIRAVLGGRLPIIALTASTADGDRADCRAAGMNDFLTKPIRMDELRACLAKWLAAAPPG